MVRGLTLDVMHEVWKKLSSENSKEVNTENFEKTLKPDITDIHKFLGEKDFIVGKLTIADFFLYELLYLIRKYSPDSLKEFHSFEAYLNRIEHLTGI